jgi:hypothetical protein
VEAPPAGANRRFAGRSNAWILAGVGGIVAVVGCLLPWLNINLGSFAILITVPQKTLSPNAWGVDTYGKVATVASVLVVLGAVGMVASTSNRTRDVFGLQAAITGAIVAFVAIFEVLSKGARVDHLLRGSFSAAVGRPISDAQFDRIKVLLDRLGFHVSAGVGMYLAIVGGALGVAGGLLAARDRRARRPPVEPGTGGFLDPAIPPPPPPPPLPVPVPPTPSSGEEPGAGPDHELGEPGTDPGAEGH